MITLTENAANALNNFFSNMEPKPIGVRVGVQGGGCSGFTYQLGYAYDVKEGDRELESHGVKIVIDRKSLLYLMGTQIDYINELGQSGFKFENPAAKRTCGCGESFGI
tara:strand:- start:7171 stop:7494 length:324 start_codon:yes stop_codon:yes gene_type:complete